MTNEQKTHKEHQNPGNKYPLSLLTDNIIAPQNIGGLFRLADALGIQHLYLCGHSPCPPNPKIKKTARATETVVSYSQHDNAITLARELKAQGLLLVALEITTQSLALDDPRFQKIIEGKNVCLILGAENTGVQDGLLQMVDASVHIPMQGQNSSMNVVTATAIACYEIIGNIAVTRV